MKKYLLILLGFISGISLIVIYGLLNTQFLPWDSMGTKLVIVVLGSMGQIILKYISLFGIILIGYLMLTERIYRYEVLKYTCISFVLLMVIFSTAIHLFNY